MLLNLIDFGLSPAESVTAPRFVTDHFIGSFRQTPPKLGSLTLEPAFPDDVQADLRSRGHRITVKNPPLWVPTVIRLDPSSHHLDAAGDPKAGRHAGAY